MKIRVAVVMGGHTSEYEISLKSGAVVMAHLDQKNTKPMPFESPTTSGL